MRLVVLGGTGFLSGAVVADAIARGHAVTTVTRGLSGAPPVGVRALHADRDEAGALTRVLDGASPDAVIDTSGYSVAGAREAAAALRDAPRYAYVSSISAYRGWPPGPVLDEGAELFGPRDDLDAYGPMKAESERVLGAALGDRLLVARAGLIVGPGDRTRRLSSWVHRIATVGRVVVPDALDQPIAVVDVRDLSAWLLDGVEGGFSGAVTATGPAGMTSFGGMLEACRAAVAASGGTPAELVPVSEDRLLAAGVREWVDLPFWLRSEVAITAWQVGTGRARALGLRSRPIEESVADLWRWVLTTGFEHPSPDDGGPGLSTSRTAALLEG